MALLHIFPTQYKPVKQDGDVDLDSVASQGQGNDVTSTVEVLTENSLVSTVPNDVSDLQSICRRVLII